MLAIERYNPSLKGVLPKDYAHPRLDKQRLGQPIDLLGNIGLGDKKNRTKDILGRVYEYFLSQFASAEGKKGGQFYTPRCVVRLLVEMLAPYRGRVYDPCCGSGGMFVQSEKFIEEHGGNIGDISIYGQESNHTTRRLAKMNLAIRGIDGNPDKEHADSFHRDLHPHLKADYVLANPPFKGSLDYQDVHPSLLKKVKTKKTELLFVALILQMLKTGGRSATIVPDGVLYGSSRAHKALRKMLVEENQLEAVISLPSGVLKPYAGVSTVILVFTKGGKTDKVFFYDVKQDGYSLDDKRTPASEETTPLGPVEKNDLPDVVTRWQMRHDEPLDDRKAQTFFVPADEIRKEKYELSIKRYKEIEYEEVDYEPPNKILRKLRALEDEIRANLDELERMLDG